MSIYERYLELKKNNPGRVICQRLGDFYEVMDGDARIVADILGITLMKRFSIGHGHIFVTAFLVSSRPEYKLILEQNGLSPLFVDGD